MAHDHHHHSKAEYYLEQLFTIGVCGALGAVAVSLYFTGKLNFMLVERFHPWVLGGGITLLVMVALRAIVVWNSVSEPEAVPVHDHDHDHCDHGGCGHDHHHHHHEHVHHHAGHGHDHGHEHAHDHADHDHGHAHVHVHGGDHGHDHGWSPWRYVVLMLPAVLFMLDLPNNGFSASHAKLRKDLDTLEGNTNVQEKGVLRNIGFRDLEAAAKTADSREFYEGKRISLIGLYSGNNPKRFQLTRYKMNCCAADAIPLNAVILIDPDPNVGGVDPKEYEGKWVEVTGLVTFLQPPNNGPLVTAIVIRPTEGKTVKDLVVQIDPPGNQFLN